MHNHKNLLCHVINNNKIPKASNFSYVDVFRFSAMYTSVHRPKGKIGSLGLL